MQKECGVDVDGMIEVEFIWKEFVCRWFHCTYIRMYLWMKVLTDVLVLCLFRFTPEYDHIHFTKKRYVIMHGKI